MSTIRSMTVSLVLGLLLLAALTAPAGAGTYPPPCTDATPGCVMTPDDDERPPLLPPGRMAVSQSSSPTALPQTGEAVDTLLLIGGGLLVIGIGLVTVTRVRRDS